LRRSQYPQGAKAHPASAQSGAGAVLWIQVQWFLLVLTGEAIRPPKAAPEGPRYSISRPLSGQRVLGYPFSFGRLCSAVIVGVYRLKIDFQIPCVVRPVLVNGAIRGSAKAYRMAVHTPLAIPSDCGIPIRSPLCLCQPLEGAIGEGTFPAPGQAVPAPGFYRLSRCHSSILCPGFSGLCNYTLLPKQ
jgi:hypothetical protein